jgi:hypothetical protein
MNGNSPRAANRARTAQIALLAFSLSASMHAQSSQPVAPKSSPGTAPTKSDAASTKSYHEDWSSIRLEGSTLIAQKPLLGAEDDAPESTFVRQRYQMQWRPDDPLDLFVVRPKGVKNPPVIIYLYSFPQDTDRFKDNAWCTTVTSGGYAAVGFVSERTGHRMEHRPVKEWFVSEFQESLGASTHDVQKILNYLQTRGDLDKEHVGMFGQGSGGAIAILASAADSRIKAVDVLSPWGDWPTWLATSKLIPDDERPKYLTPEFLARAAALEPIQWLPKVKAQSLRIQNVRQDSEISDSSELKMEAAAFSTAEIDQYGDSAALYPRVGRMLDWIKHQVSTDPRSNVTELKSERVHFYPARAKAGSPLPLPTASGPSTNQAQP